MADELIDIFDNDMNLIGQAMKSQAHNEGLLHKSFLGWIIKDNKIWFQLRGKDKDKHPNMLDVSAAGHVKAGEKPRSAGVREIKEELGLTINPDDLKKLFVYLDYQEYENINNKEFTQNYLYETSKNMEDLILQPEEVDGIFEIDYLDVIKLFENKISELKIKGLTRTDDMKYLTEERTVTLEDFVPHSGNYYIKTFQTIKRYLENQNADN